MIILHSSAFIHYLCAKCSIPYIYIISFTWPRCRFSHFMNHPQTSASFSGVFIAAKANGCAHSRLRPSHEWHSRIPKWGSWCFWELKPGPLPVQPSLRARPALSQQIILLSNRPRASHWQKVCDILDVLQLPLKCSECCLNRAQGLSEWKERGASSQGSNAGC